jgi:hypothetical protein
MIPLPVGLSLWYDPRLSPQIISGFQEAVLPVDGVFGDGFLYADLKYWYWPITAQFFML